MRLLVLSIFTLLLAACSSLTSASGASSTAQPTTQPSGTSQPAGPVTSTPAAATSSPAVTQAVTPTGLGVAATGAPTKAAAGASPNGWQVYTNTAWQVQIDYPAGWSLGSAAGQVEFMPGRAGTPVRLTLLGQGGPSPAEPLPNTRCTVSKNPNGVSIQLCRDLVSFVYEAQFVVNNNWLSLSATRGADLTIFDAMISSIRPAN
jgi:hypothetical protein